MIIIQFYADIIELELFNLCSLQLFYRIQVNFDLTVYL